MSRFQEWYITIEDEWCVHGLSTNTWGTLVWDHQQKRIDELERKLKTIHELIGSENYIGHHIKKIKELLERGEN